MTYNHEETKVRDPSAAREVERLASLIEAKDMQKESILDALGWAIDILDCCKLNAHQYMELDSIKMTHDDHAL